MLVLSRRTQPGKDCITIVTPNGYSIRVNLVRVCKSTGNVRLGLDAPPEVKIIRNEIMPPPQEYDIRALRHDSESVSGIEDLLHYCRMRNERPSVEAIETALAGKGLSACLNNM